MSSDPSPPLSHIVFVLDESAAMQSEMAESKRSKCFLTATAVNVWLRGAAESFPGCKLGLIGYCSRGSDSEAANRWSGPLAGREWAAANELPGSPAAVERRTKQQGTAETAETVDFPVWYIPEAGDRAPQVAAFKRVLEMLKSAEGREGTLVVHIFAGASADGNPLQTVREIQQLPGEPVVMHLHLGSQAAVPAIVAPANRAYVPQGAPRDLFDRAGVLPECVAGALRESGSMVLERARGVVINARLLQLSQFLSALKSLGTAPAATEAAPVSTEVPPAATASAAIPEPVVSAAPPAPSTSDDLGAISADRPCLVLFMVDRSSGDPAADNLKSTCARFQEEVNTWLTQLIKLGPACYAGLVVYGADCVGDPVVQVGFDGALAGRPFVRADELEGAALRTEEYELEMSNGVGGLIRMTRKRHIYLETEPAGSMSIEPAAAAAANTIGQWRALSGLDQAPVVVVHLTRGAFQPDDVQAARARLAEVAGPKPIIQHEIVTESPCGSIAFPDSVDKTPAEYLGLCELSDGLISRGFLSAERPYISSAARGFVLNGEFDVLIPALKAAAGL